MRNLKRLLALTLAVTTLSVSVMSCGSKADQQNKSQGSTDPSTASVSGNATTGGDLSVCLGPEPNTMDPALNLASDVSSYLVHLFEGLMKYDQDGNVVEGQAASYTVSDDGLVYTFTLRDDITWSDGKEVTADDFVYAWRRVVDPDTASDYNYILDMVANANEIMNGEKDPSELGIKAVDDKTVEITLTNPCSYFLEICAYPVVVPLREDIVEGNDNWTQSTDTYVTNGAYTLTKWDHQSQIVVTKNEDYYDAENLGPDSITFVLMEDKNSMLSAFQNGDISFADDLPSEEIKAMTGNGLYIVPSLGTYYLDINMDDETFSDVNVRKALSLAIDRDYIINNVVNNNSTAADTFVPTGVTDVDGSTDFRETSEKWYDTSDYDANCEEARKLLEEAGYKDGAGIPSIEIMINPGHEAIAQAIQNMWQEELGITVTITSNDWNVFIDTRNNGDYTIARDGWNADYNDPITFLDMFTTGNGNNNCNYSNTEYDKLIEQIKTCTDQEERYSLMHQAEDILAEDQPIIPLYYYTDLYLQNDTLTDVFVSPLAYKIFKYAKTVK